jgi:hypothetical protein
MRPKAILSPIHEPSAPVSTRALVRSIGGALLIGGGLWGCVAGVDVSEEEYNAIQQQSAGVQGGSGGTGSSGSSTGGSLSSLGGSGGTGAGARGGSGGTGAGAQGGSSGAGGGSTGGTGGSSPPVLGGCADATAGSGNIQLQVVYTERAANNQISMVLGVNNMGNGFPVADLVLRYWFDDDDLDVTASDIDYVSNNVTATVTFGEALGSNYAEVKLTGAADIGQGIEQIQIRLHTSNYATLDQTNDFSFSAGADEVENQKITAYVAGAKVFGCEPGSGT